MIRYSILTLAVLFVMGYAWRDWFKSLCGVIAFMAIYLRKDMPSEMLGIPGNNPFNVMLLNVVLAWASSRDRERLRWDLPGYLNGLLLLYLFITLVAFARMMADSGGVEITEGVRMSTRELVANYFVNSYKWVISALLLYDGCRSRERFRFALFAILLIYVLLGIQAVRQVPPSADLSTLERTSRTRLPKQTGYNRVDLACMFAGASWAIFASRGLFRRRSHRFWVLMASLGVFYSLLLTAGRAGYATWGGLALVLCSLRWRRYLFLFPVLALIVLLALPAVVGRMLQGIQIGAARGDIDSEQVLAGRGDIWPIVIAHIERNPIVGYGRQAHKRLGLHRLFPGEGGENFGHPHNAYLELLLDTGIVGFMPVMAFFAIALYQSTSLFRDSRSPVFIAAGGASMALILGWMGGSLTAQTFYPREGSVGMWCAIMLTFRVYEERARALGRLRRSQPQAKLALVGPPVGAEAPPQRRPALRRAARRARLPLWVEAQGSSDTLDGQLWSRTA